MSLASGGGVEAALRTSPLRDWGVAVLLLVAVVLMDVLTPWELGFSAFYLLPVFWLAWARGTLSGLCMALASGVAWYVHDLLGGRPLSSELFRLWDALNHTFSFILSAWLVGALRREIRAQAELNVQLNAALAKVRELKGLLPVCAWCHHIRDEEGQWHTMEVFLAQRTSADTTHGICPTCQERMFSLEEPEVGP